MTKITAGPAHSSRYSVVEPLADLAARILDLIGDLSPDNADLLTSFHRIQHEYGYVPPEAIPVLAAKFRSTPAMLYGALDFYSEIRTIPPARTTVEWCSGPACLLKGAVNMRRALEAVVGCGMNENTEDDAVGLRLVQCDGTCHLAPLVRLDGRYVGPLSVSDAIKLAREIKGEVPSEAKPANEPKEGEA
jgi:formate dehydrogenase subunit gamma